jgi:DNA-binding IclR family transcriptional regulator
VTKPHPTVDRVVSILETIASKPSGLTLSALSRSIGVPKSTTHTLVQGLLATDFLEEDSGILSLGAGVELLAASRKLPRLAHDELARLAADTDETAHLSIRSGDNILIIDQVESTQPIRYSVPLRVPRPLLGTASGKLFLAELEPSDFDHFLAHQDASNAAACEAIRAQRHTIHDHGIACNIEESLAGVCTIGAAVRDGTGALIAALVIAGPAERVRPKLEQLEPMLRESAHRLSKRMQ